MAASVVRAALERVHEKLEGDTSGEVASYIPELAKVDPDRFGVSVATVDGHVYEAGHTADAFTIQSISKPFVYGMALEDHGPDHVLARVGVEPSGDAFNSIVMDEANNRPLNPMVNAGAIACAALVAGDGIAVRRQRVIDTFSRYAGRPLGFDQEVFESERRTGHRNRAIAYLELNAGMIEEPIDEHLDLYFAQCSILVTSTDLAVMAATLANGGINPLTGERALSAEHVSRVLTVMATCGMYDWSGEWMYRVGLPAKSGVGGGIIAVLPGQLGIGTFSPRLDDHGNSCRGIEVCEELGRRFSLHLLNATSTSAPIVQRRYDAASVPSKRLRPTADRQILDDRGGEIVVLDLQGDLFFGPAEQLVRAVEAALDDARTIVLNARRIHRASAAAARLLAELRQEAIDAEVSLRIAHCPSMLQAELDAADPGWPAADFFATVDDALERGEDELLAACRPDPTDDGLELDLRAVDILKDMSETDLAAVEALLKTGHHQAGAEILREGEPADRLCFLLSGSASVRVDVGDGSGRSHRLRTFAPGTVFGEAALFEGGRRTATVIADQDSVVRCLPFESIQHLADAHPGVHARLLVGIGRNLAEMLGRASSEIRALQA